MATIHVFPKLPEPMLDWYGTKEQFFEQAANESEAMLLALIEDPSTTFRSRQFFERRLEEVRERRCANPQDAA